MGRETSELNDSYVDWSSRDGRTGQDGVYFRFPHMTRLNRQDPSG